MILPPNIAKAVLTWGPRTGEWQGEMAVNTFWLQHEHVEGGHFVWEDAVQYASSQILAKLASHWGGIAPFHGSGYGIRGCKVTQMSSTGKAMSEGLSTVEAGGLEGSSSAGILPPEVALKLGFYGYPPGSFAPQKGRKRGGMFLPYIAQGNSMADGTLRLDKLDSLLTGWQTAFNDIQGMHTEAGNTPGAPQDNWNMGIASGVDGTFTQLAYLSMDNHFDSQRRRQHQTPATRHSVTISSS
jgi:hypothetical protein